MTEHNHGDTIHGKLFRTTQWSHIVASRTGEVGPRRQAEAVVLAQYWRPVYSYLLRKGHNRDEARDLTQGFFMEVVLRRRLLSKAEPAKGKFRTYLLTALDRYVVDMYRKQSAACRSPGEALLSLDGKEDADPFEPVDTSTPEQAFHHAWAATLVSEVLADVRAACEQAGQQAHWRVFETRFLKPILEGVEPPSQESLCEEIGIDTVKQVSNMAITVKRRFAASMRAKVRPWVGDDQAAEQEIRELMEILSKGGAA